MGIQLAPIEGTPYAGGTATGVIYLDANGLQRSNGPVWTGTSLNVGGECTVSPTGTAYFEIKNGYTQLVYGSAGKIGIDGRANAGVKIASGLALQFSNAAAFGTIDCKMIRMGEGIVGIGHHVVNADGLNDSGQIQCRKSRIGRIPYTSTATGQLTQSTEVDTTDATVTSLYTEATSNDIAYHMEAAIVATETDAHDEVASYLIAATFKNDGGVLTQVGSTTVMHSAEDTAGWDATFDASGTTIRLRVTGAASTNITWHAIIKTVTIA
jgi:hypothetical protein